MLCVSWVRDVCLLIKYYFDVIWVNLGEFTENLRDLEKLGNPWEMAKRILETRENLGTEGRGVR